MNILEDVDALALCVQKRMNRLASENESLRARLETERKAHAEEMARMEQKVCALLSRLKHAKGKEGQDPAG
jgi:Skp family chaperone for outer membrane proteins